MEPSNLVWPSELLAVMKAVCAVWLLSLDWHLTSWTIKPIYAFCPVEPFQLVMHFVMLTCLSQSNRWTSFDLFSRKGRGYSSWWMTIKAKLFRLSHNVVTCDVDCVVSTAYCYCSSGDEVDSHVWSYKAWFSTVISCFSTALIGAFRSLLFTRWFVSTFCNETILDNEIMVSFNVESLFTNIPIDAALQAALQKLENDPSLADRTMLTPAQITDLLTFDGTTTRSSISAVIANLYRRVSKNRR